MSPVNLTQEARQVLAEMELLMHGKGASYNSSGGGHAENDNPVPQGESTPPHDVWRQRMLMCSEDALPAVIGFAREELAQIKRRQAPVRVVEETGEQRAARIVKDGEGFEARTVAFTFRGSVTEVKRVRRAAGRDENNGKPIGTLQQQARDLKAKDLSQEQIARVLGVSQPTVSRLLRVSVVPDP